MTRVLRPDEALAVDVEAALARLKIDRMTTIKQQLEKEDLGRELLGKVAIILQTSGQASAAAEKLKQAAKLLNGDSLQEIASKLRREREREREKERESER